MPSDVADDVRLVQTGSPPYESTPGHFLFLFMKQYVPIGAKIKRPETILVFMTSAFRWLSDGVEKQVEEVDEIEKSNTVIKAKKKRAPVGRKIIMREAKEVKKATRMTATDEVFNIIKRHRKGVDITTTVHRPEYE